MKEWKILLTGDANAIVEVFGVKRERIESNQR